MIIYLKFYLLLTLMLTTFLAEASSFIDCNVKVELVSGCLKQHSTKDGTEFFSRCYFKVVTVQQIPSGFGLCTFKDGQQITADIAVEKGFSKKSLTAGEYVKLRYHQYQAMGSEGPISGNRWTLLKKEK